MDDLTLYKTARDYSLQFYLLPVLLLLSACTTTQSPVLGESVTPTPGWEKLKQSSKQAISDPHVWVSLLGAAVLQIGDLDNEISSQLREHTPVFGSTEKAGERSDDFRSLTGLAYVSTAMLAPAPADSGKWFSTKAKLLGSEWLAVQTARSFTAGLKHVTQRDRPNNLNDRSFPSGHATSASIQAQMANFNVDYLPINSSSQTALRWTFDGFAGLTAWARVEAGMHYPSDVLAGWAMGHFVSHLARSFITPGPGILIYPQAWSDGGGIQMVVIY